MNIMTFKILSKFSKKASKKFVNHMYEYTYSVKIDLSAMLLYANSILLLGRMFKHIKNYKKL